MDKTRLFEKLRNIMQEEIASKGAVGTGLMVFDREEIWYHETFGMDDLEKKTSVSKDAIYRFYSMSKPITAVAVYTLIEQGKLSVTDEVSMYLPGFADQRVYTPDGCVKTNQPMTVYHLLNMISGLEYPNPCNPVAQMLSDVFGKMESKYPAVMKDTVTFCNELGTYPLLHQPGERWNYSTSADILGAIVEVVSGKSYRTYLKETILEPLGMMDTDFYVPTKKLNRLAKFYYRDEAGEYHEDDPLFLGTQNRSVKPLFESGGAGLNGTTEDYSKFARMMLNQGTLPASLSPDGKPVMILRPETVAAMTKPQLNEEQARWLNWESLKGFNYGNLMRILTNPKECGYSPAFPGEYGWDGWAGTYICMEPTNGVGFLYMIQNANGSRPWIYNQIKQAIFEEL